MSKSPSLRRIKADIRELSLDPSDQYHAAPLEHDMFEWHFTIRGAEDTDFAGGVYHGRILLPPEYPFKPPNIVFLTPSGRFECGVKVCLSFSAHHPELWQPAWGIRLILEALISFLPTPADGAIGALDWTSEERKKLAKESVKFRCPVCCAEGELCEDLIPKIDPKKSDGAKKKTKFQEEIEKLKMLQFQNHAIEENETEEAGKKDESAESTSKETETEAKQPSQHVTDTSTSPKPPPAPAQKEDQKETTSDAKIGDAKEKQLQPASATDPPSISSPQSKQERNTDIITTREPNNIPTPPPIPANVAQQAPAAVNTATAPPAAAAGAGAAIANGNNNNIAPLVSDGLLNGMIGIFAIIVMVLLREAHSLVDELHDLGDFEE